MKPSRLASRMGRGAARLALASFAVAGVGAVSGCLTRPVQPIAPLTTSTVVEKLTQSSVNKIDLLLVVDNSRSMADKQEILSQAIPDLIVGLLNPACVDSNGNPVPTAMQPTPTGTCPAGYSRDFPPVYDVHIGLLSSSLGSFGADGCPDSTNTVCSNKATSTSNNDHGHLVTRTDPCAPGTVPTWNSEGFLAWDPMGALTPKGESQLGNTMTPGTMEGDLAELVTGDGQDGCGFESQNESWYRFLVDPSPYQTITLSGQSTMTSGIDNQLLQQRADFMRSDSLLAIINVTDETDTSLKENGFYPLFAQELSSGQPFHLPTARAECSDPAKGPNDPCCASCGESAPSGCPADPNCTATPQYTDSTENLALRAFGLSGGLMSHKARYGIEFFYPPSRYVSGLTSTQVADATGTMVTNPIYSVNANEPNAAVRDPSLVFYAAITGVPWKLIARQDADGTPDLIAGINTTDNTPEGGFKTYQELLGQDSKGNTFWDDILGDPENYVLPLSPFMQESTVPRSGTDPITGIAISPPGSPVGANTLNGHEWNPTGSTGGPPGDIEYACIFDLPTPRDCSQPGAVCDCDGDASKDNPLCDPNPNDSGNLTLQSRAKAYPGVKNLAIVKGMQNQGIAASICPAQTKNPTNADGTPAANYGYRPAVKAIIDRLKQALKGQCLPRTLTPDPTTHEVPCLIIEASKSPTCNCDASQARAPVSSAHMPAEAAAKLDPLYTTEQWNCFCEITQTTGSALTDCQDNTSVMASTNGWCYVDASGATAVGNPALVKNCPTGDERQVRFVGSGEPVPGSTVFITCEGQ